MKSQTHTQSAMTTIDLIRLERSDIPLGNPTRFPIFDLHYSLLLSEGQTIATETQRDSFIDIGAYRVANWHSYLHDIRTLHDNDCDATQSYNFTSLKLQPNTTLHIRQLDTEDKPFTAFKLLGWLEEQSLIVSGVERSGEIYAPHIGTRVECKLIAGQGVVTFTSTVLTNLTTPYPHLHLSYPKHLQVRQLRKHLRVTVTVPARAIHNDESSNAHDVSMANLSTHGGMLESPELFAQVGDKVSVQFFLLVAGQEHQLQLNALVRNVHTYGDIKPLVCYGLEFQNTPGAEQSLLEHYVFQSMLEN